MRRFEVGKIRNEEEYRNEATTKRDEPISELAFALTCPTDMFAQFLQSMRRSPGPLGPWAVAWVFPFIRGPERTDSVRNLTRLCEDVFTLHTSRWSGFPGLFVV